MNPNTKLVYIHGLEGTSQGVKASLLRCLFPGMLAPDFSGGLEARMAQLELLLGEDEGWTLVGSSFGGLMAAIYAARHPQRIRRMVLLAPALIWPDFASQPPAPVQVSGVIYHGSHDEIIPLEHVQRLAAQALPGLELRVVEDDHGLYKTIHTVDWEALLQLPASQG